MSASPHVIDVTIHNFQQAVIEASRSRPVLVDFWADWCAPCRMLGPLLDQIADSMAGRLLVAKVNTEEQKDLAMQFGIRSLPTVKLFVGGNPVDEFMGALPEPEIRAFIEKHVPRESDTLLARARALIETEELGAAQELIEKAGAEDPDNHRVTIAAARLALARGDAAETQRLLDSVPINRQDDPELQELRAQLVFEQGVAGAPDRATLDARLDADPNDSEARYQRASLRVVERDFEGALDDYLELLKRDRGYGDDAARKAMLQVFELLGGAGDLVTRYRGKMTTALF